MAEPNLRELREILQRVEAGEATPADHTAVIEFIQPILDSVQTERANVNPNANLRQQTNERLGIENTVTRDTAARPYTDWVRNNPESVDVMREVFKQYKPMDTYAGHAELSARQMAFSLPDLRHTLMIRLQQDTALNAPFTTRATPSDSAAEDAALRTFGTKYGQQPNPDVGPVRMIVPVFDEQGNPSSEHTHQTVLVHETTQAVDGFRHVERGSGRQFNVVVGEEEVEKYLAAYRARPDVEDNFEPEFFDGRVAATATQAIDPSLDVEDTSIRPAALDNTPEEEPESEVAVNPATNSAAIGNQIADLIAQNKPYTLQNLQNIKSGVQVIDAAYRQEHGQGSYIPSPDDKEAVYELQRTVQATGSLEEISLSVQIGQATIQNSVIMDGDKPLGWVQNPVVLQWNAGDVVDATDVVNIRRASVGLDPLPLPEPVESYSDQTALVNKSYYVEPDTGGTELVINFGENLDGLSPELAGLQDKPIFFQEAYDLVEDIQKKLDIDYETISDKDLEALRILHETIIAIEESGRDINGWENYAVPNFKIAVAEAIESAERNNRMTPEERETTRYWEEYRRSRIIASADTTSAPEQIDAETPDAPVQAQSGILSRGAELNGARDYLRDLDPEQVKVVQRLVGVEDDGMWGVKTMAAAQTYFAENNLDPNMTFAELITHQATQSNENVSSWDSDVAQRYYSAAAEMGGAYLPTKFADVRGEIYREPDLENESDLERDITDRPSYETFTA